MDKVSGSENTGTVAEWCERSSLTDVTRVRPRRTFGGRGCEAICDYCRIRIEKDEIEYEVDGELDGEPVTLHLHQPCHEVCLGGRIEIPDLTNRQAPQP